MTTTSPFETSRASRSDGRATGRYMVYIIYMLLGGRCREKTIDTLLNHVLLSFLSCPVSVFPLVLTSPQEILSFGKNQLEIYYRSSKRMGIITFPKRIPDRRFYFGNLKTKLGQYQVTLGLTQAELDSVLQDCENYLYTSDFAFQMRKDFESFFEFQDKMIEGAQGRCPRLRPLPAFRCRARAPQASLHGKRPLRPA
jgi:hypothetical protein